MALSATQAFALDVLRACLPLTGTDLEFPKNGDFKANFRQNPGDTLCTGQLRVQFAGSDTVISMTYELMRDEDWQPWTSCKCTVSFENDPDREWKFFADLRRDGTRRVRTFETMAQLGALNAIVRAALLHLGSKNIKIGTRLKAMGHPANTAGVAAFIGATCALTDVEIFPVEVHGMHNFVILGHRPEADMEIDFTIHAPALIQFLTEQLDPQPR